MSDKKLITSEDNKKFKAEKKKGDLAKNLRANLIRRKKVKAKDDAV
ncbi:MAG: hypothetical protein HOM96_03375 [Rickettsiales bacterium]|mgnify:CR=1 FL=1|jgi:hypothetical protein|nr:hypothetical protein [Rickettsiales bacterium]